MMNCKLGVLINYVYPLGGCLLVLSRLGCFVKMCNASVVFLKVQGLRVNIEKNRFSEIRSAEYAYDTNQENVSSTFLE